VDYSVTQQQLEEHFKECGTIKRSTIQKTAEGRSKGFAYMEFESKEAQQRSLKMNESLLNGRNITVEPKRKNLPKARYLQRPGNNNQLQRNMLQTCMMMAMSMGARGGMNMPRGGFGRGRGFRGGNRGRH
jgi:RNA recognition motif-containing protein